MMAAPSAMPTEIRDWLQHLASDLRGLLSHPRYIEDEVERLGADRFTSRPSRLVRESWARARLARNNLPLYPRVPDEPNDPLTPAEQRAALARLLAWVDDVLPTNDATPG